MNPIHSYSRHGWTLIAWGIAIIGVGLWMLWNRL